MKLFYLGFCAIALAVCIPQPAHAGWTMVFDGEFDKQELNKDAWFTRYIYSGESLDHLNDEKEVYRDDDNHIFRDGHLALVAKPPSDGKYESGMIRSKRTFMYGYIETKVKFPAGQGLSSAFWLNSDYNAEGKLSWPPEIDIFEFVNNGKEDTVKMVHSNAAGNEATGGQLTYNDPHYNTRWSDFISDTDVTTGWHVWGLMWLPDSITVYVDGLKLYTKTYKWVYKDGTPAGPAHILLNLAVGGQWAGRHGIDDSAFPQSLDVAYVRVYQFDDGKPASALRLPNVPDLASYSYHAAGDLARPVVYEAADLPPTVKPGDMVNLAYHIDSVPTKNKTRLRLSIIDHASGKGVSEQSFPLPHDTREAASVMKARISVAIPGGLPGGDYDVRLALGFCPTEDCKPESYTNIPLTPADGAVREANSWYRVGKIMVED